MIPGPESIPEPELHTFSEIDDSDSNSDSRKKWNHNTYRGVMIPWLESIPESEPIMGMIPIPVPIPRKNGIITPLMQMQYFVNTFFSQLILSIFVCGKATHINGW